VEEIIMPRNAIPATPGLDRRTFLTRTAATAIVVSSGALICAGEAWGLEVKALKPETARTLIKVARDIYPHDRLPDKFYAVAVKGYDVKAGKDPATLANLEGGVAALDAAAKAAHGVAYVDVGWEAQRVALLRQIQDGEFFQGVRSDLVVSLYNQKEVWPLFGYEGESASKGGYINRGFNDIQWL
jgi:hypothetical protein